MKSLEAIFGPNTALVEELYEQYLDNPKSVPQYWQQYFDELDLEDSDEAEPKKEAVKETSQEPSEEKEEKPEAKKKEAKKAPAKTAKKKKEKAVAEKEEQPEKPSDEYVKIKGVASKIVDNMEISLGIPTATSLRVVPVKMLLEDRKVINSYLEKKLQPKATLTHLIGWAIVRSLKEHPKLNARYEEKDGDHYRVEPGQINLGIAVDLPARDGGRNLVVPNVKAVDTLNFAQFMEAFNDIITRARDNKLEVRDFEGTTISITNTGTIGTVSSMPRLMKNQGAIVATGAMNYPAEFQNMSQEVLNHLGISRVMTMTCTYDHRVIQGAESGAFLARVHELLSGEADFYEQIFRDLKIPYDPIPYDRDNYAGFLTGAQNNLEANKKAAAVMHLINMYRRRGHMLADLNPLEHGPGQNLELEFETYGLTIWDLDREFYCGGLGGHEVAPLRVIIKLLRETYCGHVAAEYSHILDRDEREWLREKMESTANNPNLSKDEKSQILHKLNQASAFEEFLHKKYIGHKRFSLEGAESLIPMLDAMLNKLADHGAEDVVLGMAHRGRLNVLVNTMGKSYHKVFAEFDGNIDPETFQGSGDVKYHLGTKGEYKTEDGKTVRMRLMPNPSHLESVNPVVEGASRGIQDELGTDDAESKVVPLLIHGDAAFAGQGVVTETLNMSLLDGYRTGGTIHVIINNQIGFTTLPADGRSTRYASDVAKMILAPIIHVNGDDPEACVYAMKLAVDYRQKFNKDVVLDVICYRKHGHNEGDEPAFTQPGLYEEINNHPPVRQLYTDVLVKKNELTQDEVNQIVEEFDELLEEAFTEAKKVSGSEITEEHIGRRDTLQKNRTEAPDTTYDMDKLIEIAVKLNTVPQDFDANPKLLRILAKRSETVQENKKKIDWGFAEALAFGSLLTDNVPVRLTGQDSERGTFSHRHAVLHGTQTRQKFVPLNALSDDQAKFKVYNSLLSEFAVVGFEFGYSTIRKDALVIWEAQFGDFFNGAQTIIDQYISSCEAKWGQKTSVVMLLPHGFEGQGPEHSSARLERFLQLCAEDNMQVVNATTPAQYFHLLRRQALQEDKKPLVVMSPKSLLRHPQAVSNAEELANGSFRELLVDDSPEDPKDIDRIIFCSGKVYYDLLKYKTQNEIKNVAINRLEQFYPFPDHSIKEYLKEYSHVKDVIWCQEEPKNMGGWYFVSTRFKYAEQKNQKTKYVGRPAAASPATGSAKLHNAEQERLVEEAFTL